MPIDILMPALSPTMEQGKLAKWLKAEGDSVKAGDIIAEIETDKATMEVEAVDEGILAKILVADGTENVAVNTPIGIIAAEGEDAKAAAAPAPAAAPVAAPAAPAAAAPAAATPATVPAQAKSYDASSEFPAGAEIVSMTVREALRDAMAEEMRRDGDVFVMGEEVAEYQGAYKVTQGLLQEFG
ncbi:MAG: biotin/lipoyl-containing protein, partial [Bosea sp. (in: a-proteobacteria)]|uniref:biotin/lipoyl-containing protein n=1 Tax=Bosea sp. (in: a-proteobacteria) TaxID=1871050 RepID=UPI0027376743